jgi:hypothetical protein
LHGREIMADFLITVSKSARFASINDDKGKDYDSKIPRGP